MRKPRFPIFILVASLIFSTTPLFADKCTLPSGSVIPEKLNMITMAKKGSPYYNLLNEVYTHVFKEVGESLGGRAIELHIHAYPAKRGTYLLKGQEVDGDLWRIAQYAEATHMQGDIVSFEEPLFTGSFIIITTKKTISEKIDGWKSFQGQNLKVNYRRGIVGAQVELAKYVLPENLQSVNSEISGLLKLAAGRIDVYVGGRTVMNELSNPKLKGIDFIVSDGKLPGVTQCWLLKKHSYLLPFAEESLRKFKKTGEVERLTRKYKIKQTPIRVITPFNGCLDSSGGVQ